MKGEKNNENRFAFNTLTNIISMLKAAEQNPSSRPTVTVRLPLQDCHGGTIIYLKRKHLPAMRSTAQKSGSISVKQQAQAKASG